MITDNVTSKMEMNSSCSDFWKDRLSDGYKLDVHYT